MEIWPKNQVQRLCCAIWKARNNCVFNGVLPIPERAIDQAKRANADYLQATFGGVKQSTKGPWSVLY